MVHVVITWSICSHLYKFDIFVVRLKFLINQNNHTYLLGDLSKYFYQQLAM